MGAVDTEQAANTPGALNEARPARTPLVITPARRIELDPRALWRYRELLYFLMWRDIKVRYKQTAIGAAWAILQPVTSMVIFSIVFGRFAGIPSAGLPYPIFVFAGLLLWLYFSQAVSGSASSVVASSNLITKVYFPRLYIPLAAVAVPAVDLALAGSVLGGLMVWYGVYPDWHAVAVIPFLLLAVVTALGIGLWLSALNVRYRDVPYAMPFLLQLWMYATPVVYPLDILSGKWQWLFAANPMAGVIEGFRWALLGTDAPDVTSIAVSVVAALVFATGGLAYFGKVEQHFADVI